MHPSPVFPRLLTFAALALALALIPAVGPRPACAAEVPSPTGGSLPAAVSPAPAPAACALSLAPEPAMSRLTTAEALLPASSLSNGVDTAWGGGRFHGFCPCGCSAIPDCNTSADCFGGAHCFRTPSCC
jgi:hypothetical protein